MQTIETCRFAVQYAVMGRVEIHPDEKRNVEQYFDLETGGEWCENQRGLVNTTFELQDGNFFLTIYEGRSTEHAEAVAEAAVGMPGHVPISRPIYGKQSFSVEIDNKPALLTPALPGRHYVGILHTDKLPIPPLLHVALTPFFWQTQQGLTRTSEAIKAVLARPSRDTKGTVVGGLSERAGQLILYAPGNTEPLPTYPELIHDDMERQNILSVHNKITGLVDLDSIHRGDVLYEYAHHIFNIVFCDPHANMETAQAYMQVANRMGIIEPADLARAYDHMYAFALSDIMDFEALDADSELPPDRKLDLDLLVQQYTKALMLAQAFFRKQYGDV